MSEFNNVTIVKKANIYFGDKVTSRTIIFADGSSKTLGVMLPGDYEFNSEDKEIMSSELEVLLSNADDWTLDKGRGESFDVLKSSQTQYLSSYQRQ